MGLLLHIETLSFRVFLTLAWSSWIGQQEVVMQDMFHEA